MRSRLALRRTLTARLLPLSLLLGLVIATAAPLAYLALTLGGLREGAETRAREIAHELRREVEGRPLLWRYDSAKLLEHVAGIADATELLTVAVVDRKGRAIDLGGGGPPEVAALWVSAPLTLHGDAVADVWVAADPRPAIRGSIGLLAGFGLLGLLLGGLVYWLPTRAIDRAEGRISALIERLAGTRAALAELNQTLEAQVAARSAELQAAYEALRRKEENLRQISSRAVALQEAERRVIARELHDSAGQALTAIRIHLQLITQSAASPETVVRLAERTLAMADATLEEIRRAVTMLGPAILDDVGLRAALERLCDDLREGGELAIEINIELGEDALTPALESTIYRLTQEALTNVARHAGARAVEVDLDADEDEVRLRIADDGRGFDLDAALAAGRSRGLVGMRERVELLGGELELRPRPGGGTVVLAHLPRLSLAEDGDDSAIVVA